MKSINYGLVFIFCLSIIPQCHSQKYKTVSDTIQLNKELAEVTNDISELKLKLKESQDELPSLRSEANESENDANRSAEVSSDKASTATDGNIKHVKKAKRQAKKAYNKAKDSQSAKKSVIKKEDRINMLSSKLNSKEERLQELLRMRTKINESVVSKKYNVIRSDSTKTD